MLIIGIVFVAVSLLAWLILFAVAGRINDSVIAILQEKGKYPASRWPILTFINPYNPLLKEHAPHYVRKIYIVIVLNWFSFLTWLLGVTLIIFEIY